MTMTQADTITILGAGSWGTALAMSLAQHYPTLLWAHRPEHVESMQQARENSRYLPGLAFPQALQLTADLEQAIAHARTLIIMVPSHVFRETLQAIKPLLTAEHRLAWGSKGLETGTRKLLHTVAGEVLGKTIPMAVISGPSFAKEVARGLPTAVTVASDHAEFARNLAETLHSEFFRTYTCSDMIGVQVGGAVKNVLAIAAGIADGLGFGANTRAALITRGLAEVMRLGVALGGQKETFMGLAGLGDLVLTCTDDQSRNRRLGLALGRGESIDTAIATIGQVVEGVNTAQEIYQLDQEMAVEMPITEQVYNVLYHDLDPHKAVHTLLMREIKAESL